MSATTRQHIEKELHELWRPEDKEKPSAIFGFQRNYTTNLVVFAPTLDFCSEVDAVLQELTSTYPGRYIVLCPAAGRLPAPLRHQVSGHCHFDPAHNKRFCCDIINLEAGPEVLEHLYGLDPFAAYRRSAGRILVVRRDSVTSPFVQKYCRGI